MFPVYSVTYVPGPYPALRSLDLLDEERHRDHPQAPSAKGHLFLGQDTSSPW